MVDASGTHAVETESKPNLSSMSNACGRNGISAVAMPIALADLPIQSQMSVLNKKLDIISKRCDRIEGMIFTRDDTTLSSVNDLFTIVQTLLNTQAILEEEMNNLQETKTKIDMRAIKRLEKIYTELPASNSEAKQNNQDNKQQYMDSNGEANEIDKRASNTNANITMDANHTTESEISDESIEVLGEQSPLHSTIIPTTINLSENALTPGTKMLVGTNCAQCLKAKTPSFISNGSDIFRNTTSANEGSERQGCSVPSENISESSPGTDNKTSTQSKNTSPRSIKEVALSSNQQLYYEKLKEKWASNSKIERKVTQEAPSVSEKKANNVRGLDSINKQYKAPTSREHSNGIAGSQISNDSKTVPSVLTGCNNSTTTSTSTYSKVAENESIQASPVMGSVLKEDESAAFEGEEIMNLPTIAAQRASHLHDKEASSPKRTKELILTIPKVNKAPLFEEKFGEETGKSPDKNVPTILTFNTNHLDGKNLTVKLQAKAKEINEEEKKILKNINFQQLKRITVKYKDETKVIIPINTTSKSRPSMKESSPTQYCPPLKEASPSRQSKSPSPLSVKDKLVSPKKGLIPSQLPSYTEKPLITWRKQEVPPERELFTFDGRYYVDKESKKMVTASTFVDTHYTWLKKTAKPSTQKDKITTVPMSAMIRDESLDATHVLGKCIMDKHYLHTLEFFFLEFIWEDRLIQLGLEVEDDPKTVNFHYLLFSTIVHWRDAARKERGLESYTILHAVKELEHFRLALKKSVSWFYRNTILVEDLLNTYLEQPDVNWMYSDKQALPILNRDGLNENNINEALESALGITKANDRSKISKGKSSHPLLQT
ncbi:uncharacterized protein NDAI_0C02060 [Naumovozyma dairenensis CBS 421]|uniref:Uncharacterized protein n=1 Tax=Naumovozyma dairenensis (strain ATCC 10597 / BCRC 20456 / CBS 421 / NBRC 0211 / NRRL Y-12639) TaxID=1071378 RepID=G0W7V5_NAUDC|nr:hypothetical protein NDAI_0C02060 [Naumovozyma dairenensis CBS 421]CCD23866.1 hypothetical protein NDAI_0C02060 [Naumovozyma dairenensis CBS 421]